MSSPALSLSPRSVRVANLSNDELIADDGHCKILPSGWLGAKMKYNRNKL